MRHLLAVLHPTPCPASPRTPVMSVTPATSARAEVYHPEIGTAAQAGSLEAHSLRARVYSHVAPPPAVSLPWSLPPISAASPPSATPQSAVHQYRTGAYAPDGVGPSPSSPRSPRTQAATSHAITDATAPFAATPSPPHPRTARTAASRSPRSPSRSPFAMTQASPDQMSVNSRGVNSRGVNSQGATSAPPRATSPRPVPRAASRLATSPRAGGARLSPAERAAAASALVAAIAARREAITAEGLASPSPPADTSPRQPRLRSPVEHGSARASPRPRWSEMRVRGERGSPLDTLRAGGNLLAPPLGAPPIQPPPFASGGGGGSAVGRGPRYFHLYPGNL